MSPSLDPANGCTQSAPSHTAQRGAILSAFIALLLLCSPAFPTGTAAIPEGGERVWLRCPEPGTWVLETPVSAGPADWIKARPESGGSRTVEFGRSVLLQLDPGAPLAPLIAARALQFQRGLAGGFLVLVCPDPTTALHEASRLARLPGVRLSRPVLRQALRKHGPVAPPINDPYFSSQWYYENRDTNGTPRGPDLNIRQAWYATRGRGVVLAVADDGVQMSHPEFVRAVSNSFHFNFINGNTNAGPASSEDRHSTAVAGFALAAANNSQGIAGAAPEASLASWKIFNDSDVADEVGLATMFGYLNDIVWVQNHSWGNAERPLLGPTPPEAVALSNALTSGRQGRGVVMVRSAGNDRQDLANANDDGYANDPRVITVAAVSSSGRAAEYSNPGACLLVAAPGGGADAPDGPAGRPLISTDRLGAPGWDPTADYVISPAPNDPFEGTSFAAPQVAGLAALILAANPILHRRDVRILLALSARQSDPADPELHPNGTGLPVSRHTGFGLPDAGLAVELARQWSPAPASLEVRSIDAVARTIPDDGLRLLITGTGVPPALASIPATPSLGPHADDPTAALPLVDLGLATTDISADLHGKAALIQRGVNTFREKIERAAAAGAAFVVIDNNAGGSLREPMGDTDFVPVPAVLIDQNSGTSLRAHLAAQPETRAQLKLSAATARFIVNETLRLESVRLQTALAHPRRGDLRITLTSPQGTRSVLQHLNYDDSPATNHWTYSSAHHLGESSAGTWTAEVADEDPRKPSGSVTRLELILDGVPILDTDRDGLDDDWERARLGGLQASPREDPDQDGRPNGWEQLAGTDPLYLQIDTPFTASFSLWNSSLGRLSWRGFTNRIYDVYGASEVLAPLQLLSTVPGRWPELEWFTPIGPPGGGFFRVVERRP